MSDNSFEMDWRPASIEEVKEIVQEDLVACDPAQRAVFDRYAVEPYPASIVRYNQQESVIVVARRNHEVIYWEDVECGFNVSPIDDNGAILEHRCNQDELCYALNGWIEGRTRPGKFGPARSIP